MQRIGRIWHYYTDLVKRESSHGEDINNWRDRLFISFLIYCLPVSLIAVIPGIYMSFANGYFVVGVADSLGFLLLAFVALNKRLSLEIGKHLIIGLFYLIAIILIANLGYIGPGVFYLFGLTMLIAMILPIRHAYVSVVANTVILIGFAVLIYLKPFVSPVFVEYTVGQWLAFSANLIFFSLVLLVLLHSTFDTLQESNAVREVAQTNYKNIFENSPSPMWLFDIETLAFLEVNDAASSLYGYSRKEFLNMTIRDIRPDNAKTSVDAIVRANRYYEKFCLQNVTHQKKNGELIQVKIESSSFDFRGLKAKLVLINDITEQIKVEQDICRKNIELSESEADLRAIFESSIDGFVLLDEECCIKAFNHKANEFITANGKGEFSIGDYIVNYVHQSRRVFFTHVLRRAIGGEAVEYDLQLNANDNIKWVHYALTPVRNTGQITGLCITGRNVTEQKQYVQTIEQQNAALKNISWMQSHLVRSPLTRLMSLTDLLANCDNECEKAEMLHYLKVSALELDDVIRKITTSANEIEPST